MKKAVLEVNDLYVSFGEKDVIKGVTFQLFEGQVTALLGLNGCGKTTLIKAICGLIPSKSSCSLQGKNMHKLNEKQKSRHISYIAQHSDVPFSISVLDVVLMGFNSVLGMFENPNATHREKALDALNSVGLLHRSDDDFTLLSGGQKQLVILARAIVQDTPILLFDEADSALDFTNRHMMYSSLQELLIRTNKSAIFSMHDANFALSYCERLILMKDGRIAADIIVKDCKKGELVQALSKIYGEVSLITYHDDKNVERYVMVQKNF